MMVHRSEATSPERSAGEMVSRCVQVDVPGTAAGGDPGRFDPQRIRDIERRVLAAAHEFKHPLRLAQAIRPLTAHWGHAYTAMLARFLGAGYAVRPVRDWFVEADAADAAGETVPTPRALHLRHDVHWTGIPAALSMMDLERTLGISSTYYVMWDYRRSDRRCRDDYLRLREFGGDDFEYGLHESVLDEAIFRTRLGGEEDAPATKAAVSAIFEESKLLERDPAELMQRGADGIWRWRSPDDLQSVVPAFAAWIREARSILAERIESFREAFGHCETVNGHGGYAFMRLRELGGLPAEGSFQLAPPFDGEAGPTWRTLCQTFRMLEGPEGVIELASPAADASDSSNAESSDANVPSEPVRSPRFLETAVHRTAMAAGHDLGDLWDAGTKSGRVMLREFDAVIETGEPAWLVVHPDTWSSQSVNDLADGVLEDPQRSWSDTPIGPARHALYRTALMRTAHRDYTEADAEWIDDPAAVTNYAYRIGNIEDRRRRLEAVMEATGIDALLPGSTLIDLGGGSGTIVASLRTRHDVVRASVHDIDEPMLDFQRRVNADLDLPEAAVLTGDFRTWQMPEAPFAPADILLSYGAFEFIPLNRDIRALFQECGRAVRSGGAFIVNVWNHHHRLQGYSRAPWVQLLPSQRLRLVAARAMGKDPNPYFRSLSHARWRKELSGAGFEDIRIMTCRPTRGGFRIEDVERDVRAREQHVWIVGRRR